MSGRLARRQTISALLVVSLGLLGLLHTTAARADADPASDVLLGAPVFYPYQPPVSQPLQRALEGTLARVKARGLNLKVALIESAPDLGAVAGLFGKPQQYASFLDQEISFNRPQPLLVVMPNGFGVSHAVAATALSGLKVDTAQRSDGLARAAIAAVQRIARAAGKPIGGPGAPSGGGSGSGSTSPLITFGGPALLVILVVFVLGLLRRRLPAAQPEGGDGDER